MESTSGRSLSKDCVDTCLCLLKRIQVSFAAVNAR